MAQANGDVNGMRTESVDSCESLPSSSSDLVKVARMNLEQLFPSVFRSLAVVTRQANGKDSRAFCCAANFFVECYQTAIIEMCKFPGTDSSDEDIQFTTENVAFIIQLYKNQIDEISLSNGSTHTMSAMSELAVELLRYLLFLIRQGKALPSLPVRNSTSTLEILSDTQPSLTSESTASCSSGTKVDCEIFYHHYGEAVIEEQVDKVGALPSRDCNHSLRGRLAQSFKKKAGQSKVSLFSCKARPSASHIAARKSVIYFPGDPLDLKDDDDEVKPQDSPSQRYDTQGHLKAGTFRVFVEYITAKRRVQKEDELFLFFYCFRRFSNPAELFEELVRLYDEAAYSQRELQMRRASVAKVFDKWLSVYWKADLDSGIFPVIKRFVEQRIKDAFSDDVNNNFLRMICAIESQGQANANADVQQKAQKPSKIKKPTSKKLKFLKKEANDPLVQLQAFNSYSGRQEVARQLTAKISELFHQAELGDLVKYWGLSAEQKMVLDREEASKSTEERDPTKVIAIRDCEQALSMWVSYTIIKPKERSMRVDLICFWLDVAIQLLDMRNFSSASCVYAGVAHGSVCRMKATILSVPARAKAQYHRLARDFNGFGNYGEWRTALNNAQGPMVPLTAALKHDVGVLQAVGVNDDLIDIRGYRILTKTIKSLESHRVPYDIPKDNVFQAWLDEELRRYWTGDLKTLQELYNKLYDRARKRESVEFLRNLFPFRIDDAWSFVTDGHSFDKITRVDPQSLAANATTWKSKSILQSFCSRGTKKA